MIACMHAELLKFRKRPAIWILGVILLVLILCLGYVFPYFFIVIVPVQDAALRMIMQELRTSLFPPMLVAKLLPLATNMGGPIAVILGCVAVGSEYNWGTVKTILTQYPRRFQVLGGKFLALGLILVLGVLLIFGLGGTGSLLIAVVEAGEMRWPALTDILLGMGALWLILAAWVSVGLILTLLFQSTALGLGLGLMQIMMVEATFNLLSLQNPLFQSIRQFLPGANATALAMSFSSPMIGLEQGMLTTSIGAVQAACVLAGYTIGAMIVAFWLFGNRDLVR